MIKIMTDNSESIELTDEQKEVKEHIRFMIKIMLYVPFLMILLLTISVIIESFKEGFY